VVLTEDGAEGTALMTVRARVTDPEKAIVSVADYRAVMEGLAGTYVRKHFAAQPASALRSSQAFMAQDLERHLRERGKLMGVSVEKVIIDVEEIHY
jgi:regulator of protease activity HflC (stomatin/prohibitin superfamily)